MSYKIKCKNEDFQVTEVPLTPHFTNRLRDKYTYLWVQKSGFSTFDCYDALKDFFELAYHDINNQGLKDEEAITEQIISVKRRITLLEINKFNKKYKFRNKFIKIKHILGTGDLPVKEKMLHGNSFRIVVRNLDSRTASDLTAYLREHRSQAMVNFYDSQRFGMPGGPYNTHHIGKAIVEGDWKQAHNHIKLTQDNFDIKGDSDNPEHIKNSFRSLNHRKIAFFVSSYNSFLWNKSASLLVKSNTKTKPLYFENVGKLHVPIGHDFACPYVCVAEGYDFVSDEFNTVPKKSSRRAVVHTAVYAGEVESDELHRNKKKVALSFFLPTGSYATMLIRQIFLRIGKRI